HDADLPLSEELAEIAVLLIGKSLDGRGVEDRLPERQRAGDGCLRHHCFAGAGGRRKQQRAALLDGLDGLDLERIEREWIAEAGARLCCGYTHRVAPYPLGILRRVWAWPS